MIFVYGYLFSVLFKLHLMTKPKYSNDQVLDATMRQMTSLVWCVCVFANVTLVMAVIVNQFYFSLAAKMSI